jgi:hypothetical protein
MIRILTTVVIFLSLLLLSEYASSTKMKSSWKNPSAKASSLQFQKVLVVAVIRQDFTRKIAEDKAVDIIHSGGTEAVPSYTIFTEEELENKEEAKLKIADMGFDGAIVMRSAGSKDAIKYDSDSDETEGVWYPYYQFWDVYSAAWGAVYNVTSNTELQVFIETMLYSLKENKLIWAGITETKNPKNPAKVVAEIAAETTKHLQKQGLLPKKK